MDFSFGRIGRHSFQIQSRIATDNSDGGTYNLCNAAYVKDIGGDPYQTSVGVALRQDTVTTESTNKQGLIDTEADKLKYEAAVQKVADAQ